ncbi:MAG: hypothetical protein K5756_02445 [Clostridiales bacterium]|nr:hypothetical protein [Clostridiales bacterium]
MDKENEISFTNNAPEYPEKADAEHEMLSAEDTIGDAAIEENIDLSGCSDEELDDIISGRITYEEYIASHQPRTLYPEKDLLSEEDPLTMQDISHEPTDRNAQKTRKNKKKIIIPVICALVVCVGIVVLFAALKSDPKEPVFNADEYAFAYTKNGVMHIASYLSKSELEGGDESEIRFSTDRKIVAFSKVHESNRQGNDLYFCNIRNNEELSAGGVKIDSSVVKFYITRDGEHIIYTKAKEKQTDAYCYSVKDRSAVKLDSGIRDFYIPEDRSDHFFYTKSNGASTTVYRYVFDSKKPEELLKGVGKITFMSDEKDTSLFAEVSSEKEGLVDIYQLLREGGAQKLVSEALSVFYDDFLPGGNLYFMRYSDNDGTDEAEKHSFDSVIIDDKAEADAALVQPNLDDYQLVSFFGIKTYDYVKYNIDKKAYDEKLERDKIREALKEGVAKDVINNGQCTCFAYSMETNTETAVCENVSAGSIVALNKKGAPKVVFTKFRVEKQEEPEPITIDEAVTASKAFGGTLEEYLKSLVPETIIPDGLVLSVNTGDKPGEEEIKDYSSEKAALFFIDNGNKLIAVVRDDVGEKCSMVCMTVSDEGIGVINSVDNNITKVIPLEHGCYYLRVNSGRDEGDLYYYPESGTAGIRLLSVVEDMISCKDGNLLVSYRPNGAVSGLSLCSGENVEDIDTNVNFQQIAYYSSDCIIYVKKSDVGSGDLYLYNGKASPVFIDSGVSKIFTD